MIRTLPFSGFTRTIVLVVPGVGLHCMNSPSVSKVFSSPPAEALHPSPTVPALPTTTVTMNLVSLRTLDHLNMYPFCVCVSWSLCLTIDFILMKAPVTCIRFPYTCKCNHLCIIFLSIPSFVGSCLFLLPSTHNGLPTPNTDTNFTLCGPIFKDIKGKGAH